MDLIPDPDVRDSYRQAFRDLHDTLARPIIIWKTPQETIASTNPNFNGFYGASSLLSADDVILTPQTGSFKARIWYLTAQEMAKEIQSLSTSDVTKINVKAGGVRIRVSGDAREYLKEVENITFDNEEHVIISNDRKHGLFEPVWFDYILQRTK